VLRGFQPRFQPTASSRSVESKPQKLKLIKKIIWEQVYCRAIGVLCSLAAWGRVSLKHLAGFLQQRFFQWLTWTDEPLLLADFVQRLGLADRLQGHFRLEARTVNLARLVSLILLTSCSSVFLSLNRCSIFGVHYRAPMTAYRVHRYRTAKRVNCLAVIGQKLGSLRGCENSTFRF